MENITIAILTVGLIALTSIITMSVFMSKDPTELALNAFLCIGSLAGSIAISKSNKKKEPLDDE